MNSKVQLVTPWYNRVGNNLRASSILLLVIFLLRSKATAAHHINEVSLQKRVERMSTTLWLFEKSGNGNRIVIMVPIG